MEGVSTVGDVIIESISVRDVGDVLWGLCGGRDETRMMYHARGRRNVYHWRTW